MLPPDLEDDPPSPLTPTDRGPSILSIPASQHLTSPNAAERKKMENRRSTHQSCIANHSLHPASAATISASVTFRSGLKKGTVSSAGPAAAAIDDDDGGDDDPAAAGEDGGGIADDDDEKKTGPPSHPPEEDGMSYARLTSSQLPLLAANR